MMATKIYNSKTLYLIDGTSIYVTPLKIKYLRDFMTAFKKVNDSNNSDEKLIALLECIRIAMQQYCPFLKTVEDVEDSIDIKTMYEIIDIAGEIKIAGDSEDEQPQQQSNQSSSGGDSWEELDLVRLESEVFLLGIWKDYEELEESLSMPELLAILKTKKDLEYEEKKFFAAIQGVDLEQDNSKQNAWEEMKARVASKISGIDVVSANDITSFQGIKAQQAGFGIGMGIDYEKM